jgi:hypothetical protein
LTSYLWYGWLHNLRSPFKISFYLVPPIVFSFRAHAFLFTWGPYAAFHGMALTCHIEGSMITAIWTHLRMFQNSKFYQFMLNVEFCLSRCWGRGRWFALNSTVHEQAQSNRVCNIFNFAVLGFLWGFLFLYFMKILVCLFKEF